MNTRAVAAKIVNLVAVEHRSLDQAFSMVELHKYPDRDQSFIRNLSFGTIRWYLRLKPLSELLLHKPLPKAHRDVEAILLVGLYQLIDLDTPHYAAVSETVDAAKTIRKKWATGLINKILHLFLEKKTELLPQLDKNPQSQFALPGWLVEKIQKDWPTESAEILTASNIPAPMTLRINPQQTTREKYLELLSSQEITALPLASLPYALTLAEPTSVSRLPGFNEGSCYVQDEAGQYASRLLQLEPQLRVLDACAAPGSKMTDILLTEPDLHLIAVDKDQERLNHIVENLQRLRIPTETIQLICADIFDLNSWWDGKLFDRILLDAPCSATGVIRRHPDIKLLRKKQDISQQAELQQRMLTTLWPLLKKDGILLYSTCSILKEENQNNVDKFLKSQSNAQLYSQATGDIHKKTTGWQLFPRGNGNDGFYYATLKKT